MAVKHIGTENTAADIMTKALEAVNTELHSLENLPSEEQVQTPTKTFTVTCRWLSLGTYVLLLLPTFYYYLTAVWCQHDSHTQSE
ncbi:uncharacterized protein PITG_09745 [Phytophthora infestans T30-4]|uniref:Uncharacterized protein n=1 Tax=Phytophthora infestans (strain T30-4) TaxID=403677 RepID=D0NCQ0_PHYIT|nr:uncharacterized protein PITG_09745 [Phytophthora infestans T30-4]EEY55764.1 hypothetical protein PITG_09745 [Phytophthora infestans T30-4]|eukprot:XP_002903340.1 hypothetical protein PITG_09745 [Phytophthora infestans T30-4]